MITNILEYLERTAKRLPEKIALADDKLSLIFSQWLQQAESIGTAIAQATGSTIRRAVLVFVDRRIEGLVGAMGVVESGNFYVPIDCKMPFERVRLIADVCKPIAAVATTEADLKTLDQIEFAGSRFLYNEVKEYPIDYEMLAKIREQIIDLDPVYSIFTSGSTGTPKKMRVLKSRMLSSARRTNDFFGLKKGDRTLLCMSLDYIAGKMMAVRAIERGLQMDVVEPCGHPLAHFPSFGKAEGGYDFIAMVPMQVWNTLHDEKERARLCETRQLLIGGGEISREMESLLAPLPCHSWSSYGMTETL